MSLNTVVSEQYQAIIGQVAGMLSGHFYIKDSHGRYIGFNKDYLESLKTKQFVSADTTSIIGITDHEFFNRNIVDPIRKVDLHVQKIKKSGFFFETVRSKQNSFIRYISYKKPLYDESNLVCGVMGQSFEFTCLNIDGNEISLTTRELECYSALYHGLTQKQTAKQLKLSPRTIETHINNLRSKLRCQHKIDLIIKAKKNGLGEILAHSFSNVMNIY